MATEGSYRYEEAMNTSDVIQLAMTIILQEVPAAQEGALEKLLAHCTTVGSRNARSGTALALQTCAAVWDGTDVSRVLEFLIERGVLDDDDTVRSLMVEAGRAWYPRHE